MHACMHAWRHTTNPLSANVIMIVVINIIVLIIANDISLCRSQEEIQVLCFDVFSSTGEVSSHCKPDRLLFFCSLLLQSVMSNYGKVAEFRSCINSEKVSDRKTTIIIIITIIPEWPVRRNPSYLHTAYLGLFVMVWEQISIIIMVGNVAVNLSITL